MGVIRVLLWGQWEPSISIWLLSLPTFSLAEVQIEYFIEPARHDVTAKLLYHVSEVVYFIAVVLVAVSTLWIPKDLGFRFVSLYRHHGWQHWKLCRRLKRWIQRSSCCDACSDGILKIPDSKQAVDWLIISELVELLVKFLGNKPWPRWNGFNCRQWLFDLIMTSTGNSIWAVKNCLDRFVPIYAVSLIQHNIQQPVI